MSEVFLKQVDYVETPDGHEVAQGTPAVLSGLQVPEIYYDDLLQRISEANDTYGIIKGPSGRQYEIISFNPDKASSATIAKPSTSFSSGRKNPANVLETALTATANPGARYVYIASFGNNPTGHMSHEDLMYLAKSGRYTTGDGIETPYQPLDSVRDMAEMLEDNGLAPTHFSADEEAGRLALGLMTALDKDSILGVYLNGIDGISPNSNYVKAQLGENIQSRIRRRGVVESKPGELTPVNIKDLKRRMPNAYKGIGKIAHLAPLPLFLYPRDVYDKIRVMQGFHGHDDQSNLATHAVFNDARAALLNQEAPITMQFNVDSAMHEINQCIRLGKSLMDSIPPELRSKKRIVRLLIGEGTLDQHADNPHERTRVERLALSDIAQQMTKLLGGLTEAQVFELKPLMQAA